MEFDINPNTQVCTICKVRRHNFLFDRTDGVCNWCNEKEESKTNNELPSLMTYSEILNPENYDRSDIYKDASSVIYPNGDADSARY